jgi:hypothetical protein
VIFPTKRVLNTGGLWSSCEALAMKPNNRKFFAEGGFWLLLAVSSYFASKATTSATWVGVACVVLALALLYWCRRQDEADRNLGV